MRSRLLGDQCRVDTERMQKIMETDTGIDRLESFGAKFSRMQDTVVDKLIPGFLNYVGEQPAAAVDNLDRLERLGLITSAEDWISMRWLRNRLAYEYFDDLQIMAAALEQACRFTSAMHIDYQAIRNDVNARLKHQNT